ncbi:MAG: ATP-binding protein [Bacteroidota bacterium]
MKFFEKNSSIFKLLFEGVSEGIIVVNQEQLIVASNGSTNQMFGYADEELVGKKLITLIPSNYHKSHRGHFSTFMARSEKRRMGSGLDLYGIRKNKEKFPVEVGLNPFDLDGNIYVMALIIDITERKEHETQIRKINEALESKVKQRTKELEKTVGELREAERKAKDALQKEKELGELKTKFLSLVSHEFKTPLSTILTSTTLLSKYTLTDQQEKRDKHLGTIKGKVKYLNNILNDFLSVERLESGKVKYKFSRFSLSKIINEVIYDANTLLKDGQKILYPKDIDMIVLEFDEKILELALSNLIHNAIKYSPEHTDIAIKVVYDTKNLLVKVIDNGIGIPEEEQKFVFDRYFRASNALLSQGTGIGLNIAKRHFENLDGTIYFHNNQDKGTTFIAKIPLKINQ